ncbi:MAG TPA: hypothetical protein VN476_17180 [Pyrinomonadaceae bacterium]|nr:hypothetical protein [Pyrinomonadaceae bacterium]
MSIGKLDSVLLLVLGLAISIFSLNIESVQAQARQNKETRKIHGAVMDRYDRGISGVLVRAYRGNRLVGVSRTTETGQYSILLDVGEPITTIRYEHSDWIVTTVNEISGARDNLINKILTRQGEHLSSEMQKEFVLTIDRLYYIDRANAVSDDSFRRSYQPMIERSNLPDELLAKLPIRFNGNNKDLPSERALRALTSGEWIAFAYAPGAKYEFMLRFEINGNRVTGEGTTQEHVLPIASGSLKGDELSFVINSTRGPFALTAIVKDRELVGEFDLAGEVGGFWRAVKTR